MTLSSICARTTVRAFRLMPNQSILSFVVLNFKEPKNIPFKTQNFEIGSSSSSILPTLLNIYGAGRENHVILTPLQSLTDPL